MTSHASAKVMRPLLAVHHHVLTCLKCNAVAYHPAPQPKIPRRRRPRRYGEKVRLRDLWHSGRQAFQTAANPVYGESGRALRYYAIGLLWRLVG